MPSKTAEPAKKIPSAPSRPEFFRHVLLVAGSIAFGLALLELPALFNWVNYGRILGINADWLPRNRVSDPELLHTGRPNAHFAGSTLGGNSLLQYRLPDSALTRYQWDVTYDDKGFRNPPGLMAADIAVVGDSFVEGMTVSGPRLMTSVLANLERKTVANLGQSGYGPQQEFVVLKRYAAPLHPRTVVWLFYEGNDLEDVEQYDRTMHQPPGFWEGFAGRSFTRNALARIYHLTKPPGVKGAAIVRASGGAMNVFYFDRQSAFSAARLTPDHLKAIARTTQIIRGAHEFCAAAGIKLIVAFVPTAFRAVKPYCRFPAESDCRGWVLNDLPDRMREAVAAASKEVGYLDLTPALSAAVGQGNLPYYRDDAHWTEDGHRIAAEAIHAYLSSGTSVE
jgi:hypothetical protein